MILEQERNDDVGIDNRERREVHLEIEGPRVFFTKRADQRHKLIRTFGVVLGMRLQRFLAERRLNDDAFRKPQSRSRFSLRVTRLRIARKTQLSRLRLSAFFQLFRHVVYQFSSTARSILYWYVATIRVVLSI